MRVYLAVDADDLRRLAGGGTLAHEQLLPASDDEEDELAALEEAAEAAPVAVAAEVEEEDAPVALRHVQAFHVALDESGHLQWFGADELDTVLALLG